MFQCTRPHRNIFPISLDWDYQIVVSHDSAEKKKSTGLKEQETRARNRTWHGAASRRHPGGNAGREQPKQLDGELAARWRNEEEAHRTIDQSDAERTEPISVRSSVQTKHGSSKKNDAVNSQTLETMEGRAFVHHGYWELGLSPGCRNGQ